MKVHGDMEVTGEVTANGDKLGAAKLLVELQPQTSAQTGVEITRATCAYSPTWHSHVLTAWTARAMRWALSEVSDPYDCWVNNQFIAPEDGVYLFFFPAIRPPLNPVTSDHFTALKINDAFYEVSRKIHSTTYHYASKTVVVSLSQNDIVEICTRGMAGSTFAAPITKAHSGLLTDSSPVATTRTVRIYKA